tara:strand:- start:7901 stop:8131 length:231 start_codon:yes stop_codon:yes gene_type:complete
MTDDCRSNAPSPLSTSEKQKIEELKEGLLRRNIKSNKKKKEKRCTKCRRIYLQEDRVMCLKCESKLTGEYYIQRGY